MLQLKWNLLFCCQTKEQHGEQMQWTKQLCILFNECSERFFLCIFNWFSGFCTIFTCSVIARYCISLAHQPHSMEFSYSDNEFFTTATTRSSLTRITTRLTAREKITFSCIDYRRNHKRYIITTNFTPSKQL